MTSGEALGRQGASEEQLRRPLPLGGREATVAPSTKPDFGTHEQPTQTEVVYDPSRSLLSQAVELIHPALAISPEMRAQQERELPELKEQVLEIEADEIRR